VDGGDPDCDDGVDCTEDTCNEAADGCNHSPDDAACDDGSFCSGAETCDATDGCQPGEEPDCDDGVDCTVDDCDADADDCVSLPDDDACGAGEVCDADDDCRCDPLGADCADCGDVNASGAVDISDVIGCGNEVDAGGPWSCCETFQLDFEKDGDVDAADCAAIFDYVFNGGPGC
jgi:hypothetical protein